MFRPLLSFLLLLSFLTPALAQEASRVRVILMLDDKHSKNAGNDLSRSCYGAYAFFGRQFTDSFQPDQFFDPEQPLLEGREYKIDVLNGDRATYADLKAHVANMGIQPTENVFLYYCGHGGTDEKTKEPYFAPGRGGNIPRGEVRALLLEQRPNGIIILSDDCGKFGDIVENYLAPKVDPDRQINPTHDLFLAFSGMVDIKASSPGELAFHAQTMGVFTEAFSRILMNPKQDADENRDGVLTWVEVYKKLQRTVPETLEDYKIRAVAGSPLREATKQNPSWYYLGPWPSFEKYIDIKNNLQEDLNFTIHYWGRDAQGQFSWLPGDPTQGVQGIAVHIPAGQTTRVEHLGVPALGSTVHFSGSGASSGTQYGPETVRVVAPEGYRVDNNSYQTYTLHVGP